MRRNWKRWMAGGLAAVAVYAALGFWAVPALLAHQLPAWARAQLGREARVADVRFNPFTLRLEATGLALQDRDGSPLLGLQALAVELQWSSLWQRAWSFAELRLAGPAVSLRIAPDGAVNLARLAADLQAGSPPAAPDAPLPRLRIAQLAVDQGRITVDDQRAGYRNVLAPIGFSLRNFSTLPGDSDEHLFTAQSEQGGTLRWKGSASLQPLQAHGVVEVGQASLPGLAAYLKPVLRGSVLSGRLDATLPYTLRYEGGQLDARIADARVALGELALAHAGRNEAFATLGRLEVTGIQADLGRLQVEVGAVRLADGRLALRRDAQGRLDLQQLVVATPAADSAPARAGPDWRLKLRDLALERIALQATDDSASPPLRLELPQVALAMALEAGSAGGSMQLQATVGQLALDRIALTSQGRAPLRLARVVATDGTLDLQARKASLGRLRLEQPELALRRDRQGTIDWMAALPSSAPAPAAAAAGPAWAFSLPHAELQGGTLRVSDEASGIALQAQDIGLTLDDAGSDLRRPVRFGGSLKLREGGRIAAQGQVVPASGALQARVQAQALPIAPLQPLLAQHVRLRLAGGSLSAQGQLAAGGPPQAGRPAPALRYEGSLHLQGLALKEEEGDTFLAWDDVGSDRLTLTLAPHRLDVPELRVQRAQAKLIIEEDRSFNAARLLVKQPAAAAAPPPAPAATAGTAEAEPFAVRIRRVRLVDSQLDFTDLSLRPQFSARIHELNGAVNGLATQRETRSQIELDGRVDEFGLARLRGEINPFAPRDSTDLQAVFRNVDMVPASPYSMKFAGYRLKEGRISLDLRYKVRNSQLEGQNQIVLERLTLGERVDSPDAIKIPLALAIAILKDPDGRIDLGLPVSGNIDDPQFSYGGLIWKAIGNLLGRIVTAPFRALGAMLGVGGEQLEAILFDPGSARLLPPEREKLKQVAEILAKRAQLVLTVPGHYNEAADTAALQRRALRAEVARRAGIPLAADEEPGPMDLADRAVRSALRELYTLRFGKEALERETAQAEQAAAAGGTPAVPVWQRIGKFVQNEPPVRDAAAFYAALQKRLEAAHELPPATLTTLGDQRAAAIAAALGAHGLDAARVKAAPAAAVEAGGASVGVKLELAAH